MASVTLRIEQGDLLEVDADLLAVKYAQGFHASDGLVAAMLAEHGVNKRTVEDEPNEPRFTPGLGAVKAKEVLFLGTVGLGSLGYHDVRRFAARVLEVASSGQRAPRSLALTIHGANCGLDEGESVLALAGGLIDSIQRGTLPASLETITIVEKRDARAKRLFDTLAGKLTGLPGVSLQQRAFHIERPAPSAPPPGPTLPAHGTRALDEKAHAFVAMPFAPEFEDVFHYGIQQPVHRAGLLCERVDAAVFEGLIIQRILSRIATARVVVAELSGANPNVYLEVGYAWASKVPTILLVRDVNELRFDVKGHRCLVYRNIRELEGMLSAELGSLGR